MSYPEVDWMSQFSNEVKETLAKSISKHLEALWSQQQQMNSEVGNPDSLDSSEPLPDYIEEESPESTIDDQLSEEICTEIENCFNRDRKLSQAEKEKFNVAIDGIIEYLENDKSELEDKNTQFFLGQLKHVQNTYTTVIDRLKTLKFK